ncbi:hypothetical protein WR25_24732 [Diploscapter pachys]|uniref:DWNN domain-containing protein n=1 Tax=Diploscapter pachys TaxID=2018661 RepID=A0A2A2L1X0_9BILA|nr:hypothetical protein WR25_24732 [Diploscapter pachys]
MSSIFYKFRSTIDYKTYQFDGLHISGSDLKRAICSRESIRAESFDLILQNAHTKRTYSNDDLIPRNSSIVIQRVPRDDAEKLPKIQGVNAGIVTQNESAAGSSKGLDHIAADVFDKMTEEERLAHVEKVSTAPYRPENFQRGKTNIMSGPPPPTYTCNRCYQPGHWFKNCPMLTQKRTTGIPSQELVETTPDDPQAMLHPSGKYVIHKLHLKARQQALKKAEPAELLQKRLPPPSLTCPVCGGLMRDAVLTACCGNSFCADCVSQKLLESEEGQCPGEGCTKKNLSVDALIPNRTVRQSAQAWAAESEMGSSSPGQDTVEQTRIRIGLQPQSFRHPGSPFRNQTAPSGQSSGGQIRSPTNPPPSFNVGLPNQTGTAPAQVNPIAQPQQQSAGFPPQQPSIHQPAAAVAPLVHNQAASASVGGIPPSATPTAIVQPTPAPVPNAPSALAAPAISAIPPTNLPPPGFASAAPSSVIIPAGPPPNVPIVTNFSQPPPALPASMAASTSSSRSSELLPPGVSSIAPPPILPPIPGMPHNPMAPQIGINLPPYSYQAPPASLAPPGTTSNPVLDAWDIYLQKKDLVKKEREKKRRRESSSSSSSSSYSSSSSEDRDRRRRRKPERRDYNDRAGQRRQDDGRSFRQQQSRGGRSTRGRNTYREGGSYRGRDDREEYSSKRSDRDENINKSQPQSLLDSNFPRPSNVRGDLFIGEKEKQLQTDKDRERPRSERTERSDKDGGRKEDRNDDGQTRHRLEDRDRERERERDRDKDRDRDRDREREKDRDRERRRERDDDRERKREKSPERKRAKTTSDKRSTPEAISEKRDRGRRKDKESGQMDVDDEAAIDAEIKEAEQLQKIQATVAKAESIEFEVEENERPESADANRHAPEDMNVGQSNQKIETDGLTVVVRKDRQPIVKDDRFISSFMETHDIPEDVSEEGAENEDSHPATDESTDEKRPESRETANGTGDDAQGDEEGHGKKKKHKHKEKKNKKHKKKDKKKRAHSSDDSGEREHKHHHKKHKKEKKAKKERNSEEERERKERKKAKKAKKEKERGQHSPDSDRKSCDEERERDEDRKSSDRSERMRSGEERRRVNREGGDSLIVQT